MNFNSIKIKFLLLLVSIGVIFGLLLAFFSPNQAKKLGAAILKNDATFISQLLADNLAVGLATFEFDEGESIKTTLNLVKSKKDVPATISNAKVFDKDLKFMLQLDPKGSETTNRPKPEKIEFFPSADQLLVWMPIMGEDGSPSGYLELNFSKYYLNSQNSEDARKAMWLTAIVLLVLLVPSAYYIRKKAVSIEKMVRVADDISNGDINVSLDVHSLDEIGALADSFRRLIEYIRRTAQAADSISSGDLTTEVSSVSERDVLSNSFIQMLKNLNKMFKGIAAQAGQVNTTSKDLGDISAAMIENSENLASMSSSVAGSSNEMNSNIGVISSNTQDMTTTIEEISKSVEQARTISATAVQTSVSASSHINELQLAAAEISNVSDVIISIADQTKLLALNATIEAARAGEAGKGFAVVAGEVKQLAFQTNQATEEIRGKMEAMKASTENVVGQIGEITSIINKVNDYITNIAATVEEQSVTTRNIAQNINETASSFGYIATEMNQMQGASNNVKEASNNVSQKALALNKVSSDLNQMIQQFKMKD